MMNYNDDDDIFPENLYLLHQNMVDDQDTSTGVRAGGEREREQ